MKFNKITIKIVKSTDKKTVIFRLNDQFPQNVNFERFKKKIVSTYYKLLKKCLKTFMIHFKAFFTEKKCYKDLWKLNLKF